MKRISVLAASLVLIGTASRLPARDAGRAPIPTVRPNTGAVICAHRGVKKVAPENTIPAIEKAIELGYDWVEIDVRYTKDGVPVLMHDSWVTRTTGGWGPVSSYDLAGLKKLDAGRLKRPRYAGTRVPTVEEALKAMQGRIKLYLDQKEPPRPELIRLLKRYGFYPDNMVIVGGGENTKKFLAMEPEAPVMPGLDDFKDVDELLAAFPSAVAVNTSCEWLTAGMVDSAHARGLMVFTNVINAQRIVEYRCVRVPIELGSDVIQIDNPDAFFTVIEEYKKGEP